MRRLLISLMLSLMLGALCAFFLSENSGYVLISFDRIVLEMTFWAAVMMYGLSLISIYLLWLLTTSLRNPFGLMSWRNKLLNSRAVYRNTKGLQAYCTRNWDLAAENLLQGAKESANPPLSMQFAARASASQGDLSKAIEILKNIKLEYPDFSMEADRILADLLSDAGQTSEALSILQELYSSGKDNNLILPDLVKAFVRERDWIGAMGHIKPLRSIKTNYSKERIRAIEMDVYVGHLAQVASHSRSSIEWSEKELRNFWLEVPKYFRSSSVFVSSYAIALDHLGRGEEAQKLLLKRLKSQWHPVLIESLGKLNHPLSEGNQILLEEFLVRFPDDQNLLLALGRVCARLHKFVQACDHLEKALQLGSNPEVLLQLAEAKAEMGDHAASAKFLRRGLAIASKNVSVSGRAS